MQVRTPATIIITVVDNQGKVETSTWNVGRNLTEDGLQMRTVVDDEETVNRGIIERRTEHSLTWTEVERRTWDRGE